MVAERRRLVLVSMWFGRYDELAKGQMLGGATGMLKILFHADSLKVGASLFQSSWKMVRNL
jgi:hypothetical protein